MFLVSPVSPDADPCLGPKIVEEEYLRMDWNRELEWRRLKNSEAELLRRVLSMMSVLSVSVFPFYLVSLIALSRHIRYKNYHFPALFTSIEPVLRDLNKDESYCKQNHCWQIA